MIKLPPFLTELTNDEYKITVTTLGGNNFTGSYVHTGYVSAGDVREAEASGWLAVWPTSTNADVPEVPDATWIQVAHIVTVTFAD